MDTQEALRQTEKERVIIKIRKLFAMSESTSINEAAIAAEKAQALMKEYGISSGDFMAALDIPTTKKIPLWQQSLACAIRKLYGVVLRRNENCVYEDIDEYGDYSVYEYSMQFIGDEVYAMVAHEMFIYLRDTIKRLSATAYGRSAKDAFCKGASHSVIEKLQRMGTDDLWISQRDIRYTQARDYVENTLSLSVPTTVTVRYKSDKSNYDRGRDAGNRISLHRQAGGIDSQAKITEN
jgi:hypothetical protein